MLTRMHLRRRRPTDVVTCRVVDVHTGAVDHVERMTRRYAALRADWYANRAPRFELRIAR